MNQTYQPHISIRVTQQSLDELSETLPDRRLTPIEEFLEKENRQEILRQIKTPFLQMLFILREYGFTNKEIVKAMKIKPNTIYKSITVFRKIRKNIEKNGYN